MNMNYFIFWRGTIIGSFGGKLINELRIFKDVADAGYKINMEKFSAFQELFIPNETRGNFLFRFIPIYNIMNVCKNIIDYNNIRPILLDHLNVIGA